MATQRKARKRHQPYGITRVNAHRIDPSQGLRFKRCTSASHYYSAASARIPRLRDQAIIKQTSNKRQAN